jgi:hypothetical protein
MDTGNRAVYGRRCDAEPGGNSECGRSFQNEGKDLLDEFTLGGVFHNLLLRHTQALITQISQTAVCNRLHSVEQQLGRWLLLSHDRLKTDTLVMTHDLISNMLGVRREGVTMAARKLAARKLIKNVRGSITILDRQGREQTVCECYTVVNNEYNRLLGRGISRTFGNRESYQTYAVSFRSSDNGLIFDFAAIRESLCY